MFNPKGQYLRYSGGNRREVYLQAGKLYNIKHEPLKADLNWLEQNGYAMNAELRNEVVRQQATLRHQKELEAIQAKIAAETARLMAEQEAEINEHYKELSYSAPPPSPKRRQHEEIKLTSVEKRLLNLPDPEPEQSDEEDEEEDADLFQEGDLDSVGPIVEDEPAQSLRSLGSKGSPDPFEGVDDDAEVTQNGHVLEKGKPTSESTSETKQIQINRKVAPKGKKGK